MEKPTTKVIGSLVAYQPNYAVFKKTISTFLESAPESSFVIVCDNSPEDNLSGYLKSDFGPRVRYQKAPNNIGYGPGHNFNFHAVKNQSFYFCILNPDIEIPVSTIPALIAFQKQHSEYGLLSGGIFNFDGTPQNVHKYAISFWGYVRSLIARKFSFFPSPTIYPRNLDYRSSTPFRIPILSGCFMLFTNEHFASLGGFNEKFFMYFEDYDLSLRSFVAGKSVLIPNIPIYHHWARSSHKKFRLFRTHLKSAFIFYRIWGFLFHPMTSINRQAGPLPNSNP